MGDDLRAQFLDEACVVFFDAVDEADGWPDSTWAAMTDGERVNAHAAMGVLLAWLDSRRF